MKRGFGRASITVFLAVCVLAFGNTQSAPSKGPKVSASHMSRSRIYLLESAGGLGGGVGFAAVALPFTLAAYLFSGGDITQTVAAEGVCLGFGSAVGAWWTGRSIGQPAKFWPALGLAFLPEVGAGLVMSLTRKGADLTDPLIMGCCVGAVLASPVLATVGANLGRRWAVDETRSRVQLVPELRACSGQQSGPASVSTQVSAGLGLRLSF